MKFWQTLTENIQMYILISVHNIEEAWLFLNSLGQTVTMYAKWRIPKIAQNCANVILHKNKQQYKVLTNLNSVIIFGH